MNAVSVKAFGNQRKPAVEPWYSLLMDQVRERSFKTVARELDVSRSLVWLLVKDRSVGAAPWLKDRILALYAGPTLTCPLLGDVSPLTCADHFREAWLKGPDPDEETRRRRARCRACSRRF